MAFRATHPILFHLGISAVLVIIVLLPWLLSTGIRYTTPLETVSSIPYPVSNERVVISEPLTHFDIQTHQPLLAKKAVISITFVPGKVDRLALGIRENSFWLSYTPVTFYDRTIDGTSNEPITKTVAIPLTDKLPDQDGSLDAIIFANGATAPDTTSQVTWQVVNLSVEVQQMMPTLGQTKTFIKHIIERERII